MRFVTWTFPWCIGSIPDFGHEEFIEYEVAFDSASKYFGGQSYSRLPRPIWESALLVGWSQQTSKWQYLAISLLLYVASSEYSLRTCFDWFVNGGMLVYSSKYR